MARQEVAQGSITVFVRWLFELPACLGRASDATTLRRVMIMFFSLVRRLGNSQGYWRTKQLVIKQFFFMGGTYRVTGVRSSLLVI